MNTNIHKRAFLMWLAVYPIITGLVWALEPFISNWAMPERTLILSALMVPIMVYGAAPIINRITSRS